MLKNDVLFLGLGNCGCKQAKVFYNMGYKAMFANGSAQDLKLLGDVPNIYQLKNFDGFGGHRERAMDCLVENAEFIEALQNVKEKIVFILFATGGSTGSGSAPICAEFLLEETDEDGKPLRIVCPVPTLPSANEAIAKKKNAYQAVIDLQEVDGLGATLFINNDSLGSKYEDINRIFGMTLNFFLANDSYGDLNNFDESEKLEMLMQSGSMVMSLAKGSDTNPKGEISLMTRLIHNGIFAPIEKNMVCGNIAIIHSGKDNSDVDKESVIAEVGKPYNVFEGYNGKRSLVAVSGLDYPITHIKNLGELAKKALEERMRSRKQVEKLSDLDFGEEEIAKKPVASKKSSSKLELMKKRMEMQGIR